MEEGEKEKAREGGRETGREGGGGGREGGVLSDQIFSSLCLCVLWRSLECYKKNRRRLSGIPLPKIAEENMVRRRQVRHELQRLEASATCN